MEFLSPKYLYLIFLAACLGGCSYQVIVLSQQYFNYITTSRVDAQMEFNHQFFGITLCIPFKQLSNATETNLKISEMFDLTPGAGDTLLSCKFRLHHNNRMQIFDHNQCLNYFEPMKYYTAGSICYQYHPRSHLNYSISNVANAITDPLIVYVLYLSEELKNVEELQVFAFLFAQRTFPQFSRKFSGTIMNFSVDNTILIRTKVDNYTLLPAPYDTKCDNRRPSGYLDCLNELTVRHLNRFSYTEATAKPLHLIPLSYSDLSNKTLSNIWTAVQKQCDRERYSFTCTFSITSTHVEHTFTADAKNNTLILIGSVPYSAGFSIITKPTLTAIEYFSGLCSAVGTWFGFSVLSIRPSKLQRFMKTTSLFQGILKQKAKKLLNAIFIVACFVGFLYEMYEVCCTYFFYRTVSKISNEYASYEYRVPSLSLCFPVNEMIHILSMNAFSEDERDFENEMNAFSKLLMNDIFELTPKPLDLIYDCCFRDAGNQMRTFSKDVCVKKWSITKAASGGHICYIFNARQNDTYNLGEVTKSLSSAKEIYNLNLIKNISNLSYVLVVLFDYETEEMPYPSLARNYAARVSLYNKLKKQQDNDYFVGNTWIEFTYLPHPYDTNCINDSLAYSCLRSCLFKRYQRIHRVPFSEIKTVNDSSLETLTLKDMKNETMQKFVEEIEHYCEGKCSRNPCYMFTSFTTVRHFHHFALNSVMFAILLEQSPQICVKFVPLMSLVEFIQFLCNAISIWLGFSIISLQPKNIINWYIKHIPMNKKYQF